MGLINCRGCGIEVERSIKSNRKLWCDNCLKERKRNYHYEYYWKNREDIIKRTSEWQKKPSVIKKRIDREKSIERKEQRRLYRIKHNEELKNYNKEYCRKKENKLKKNERDRIYRKKPELAIIFRLRDLLKYALRRKYNIDVKINKLNYYLIDYNSIKKHLQPYPKDISKYHIDHIRPLCSFNFINSDGTENLEEIKKAFAPENHRWLLKEENLAKIKDDLKMSIRRNQNVK